MAEIYISVDIEASGPIPGEYSMLALGACVVGAPDLTFYVELAPITRQCDPEALAVAGLNLDELAERGEEPGRAMLRFERWVKQVTPKGQPPIFVAYPIAFDWMFVAYYFHRYLGHNPFGHHGLDIKSYYMGMQGVDWAGSRKSEMDRRFLDGLELSHNAREDAMMQAEMLARMMAHRELRR